MYSDTHFHFGYLQEETNGMLQGKELLEKLAERNTFFAMDIGTKADDLLGRYMFVSQCMGLVEDSQLKSRIEKMLHFSAGIWPDPASIKNRRECMKVLRTQIEEFEKIGRRVSAIGEGGIDHHWNKNNADSRDAECFDDKMFAGEREMFEMQLELAHEKDLPFVIHSRDGFDDTCGCIRNAGHDKGILHCCSYGREEVKFFLDRGWFVSFSGSVTYTKKSGMEALKGLLNYVPRDRILLETDAPYLAPVPVRGSRNTPLYVEYTYKFVSDILGVSPEELSNTVDENCKSLFNI